SDQRDPWRSADPARERHAGRPDWDASQPAASAAEQRLMLDWLFVSPAERRLLGTARLGGPTPWVIAIMSFSIMLIAATGLALANTASVLSRAIEARYALEVPGGGGDLPALLAAVRSSP